MFLNIKVKRRFVIILVVLVVVISMSITAISIAVSKKHSKQVPIFMYHSIVKDESSWNDYVLSPVELEKDLIWLKEHGYETVFVKDLISYVSGNLQLPEKSVVITFDDGSYNNFTYVLPLLEKYDMKATFSIVGAYSEYACEEAEPSPLYSYLDWNDIIKMDKSKHCEFANHTYNMHSLDDRQGCKIKNDETYEQFRHEFLADIFNTQHLLEDNCKISPKVFAYPFGFTCEPAQRLVKNSGFKASLGVQERINTITVGDEDCLFDLGRFNRPSFVDTESFMKKCGLD